MTAADREAAHEEAAVRAERDTEWHAPANPSCRMCHHKDDVHDEYGCNARAGAGLCKCGTFRGPLTGGHVPTTDPDGPLGPGLAERQEGKR